MDKNELTARLIEIELLRRHIKSRITHIDNHRGYAPNKSEIADYNSKQMCEQALEYLDTFWKKTC